MKDKNKKTQSKIRKIIIRSFLDGVPTAASWILSFLVGMTEATFHAFFSPNLYEIPSGSLGLFSDYPVKKKPFKENTIRQSLRRLQNQGFVEKRGNKYLLSEKGRKFLRYALSIKREIDKKWDGKYRLVIFDIPEKMKDNRSWLRQELYFLNYNLLQKSVFIGKAKLPPELIKDIKARKLDNYVNYILAEKVYQNIKD